VVPVNTTLTAGRNCVIEVVNILKHSEQQRNSFIMGDGAM